MFFSFSIQDHPASLLSNLMSLDATMMLCMEGQGKICFGLKQSGEVLSKLKSSGFWATNVSTFDFLLLIPHYLIIL